MAATVAAAAQAFTFCIPPIARFVFSKENERLSHIAYVLRLLSLQTGCLQHVVNLAAIKLELLGSGLELGQAVLMAVQNVNDVPNSSHSGMISASIPAGGWAKGAGVGLVKGFKGLSERFRHVIEAILDTLGHVICPFAFPVGIDRIEMTLASEDCIDLFLNLGKRGIELVLEGPNAVKSLLDLFLFNHHSLSFGGEFGQISVIVSQNSVVLANSFCFVCKG